MRIYQRDYGPILSAVCADDFGFDNYFSVQFVDTQSGFGSAAAEAAGKTFCAAVAMAGVCDRRRLAGLGIFTAAIVTMADDVRFRTGCVAVCRSGFGRCGWWDRELAAKSIAGLGLCGIQSSVQWPERSLYV